MMTKKRRSFIKPRLFVACPRGSEAVKMYGYGMELRLRARTHHEAAQHAAHRLHGRRAWAALIAGEPGKNATYQAYVDLPTGGATSIGANFLIAERYVWPKVTP